MKKRNLIKGTLILGVAGIIAKFLGIFFRIPLIYMIGEEGIGLYQLTYPLYTFLLAISAGIPVALSKMISERIALRKTKEAKKIFKIAFIIMGVFGGTASLCLILFSNVIIGTFRWNKEAYYSLIGISLAPFFTCILSVCKGYFQGLQFMTAPAVSQVLEQITRVVFGVSLAYILLPMGIAASAGGASFGAVAGSMVGLIWMRSCFSKNRIIHQQDEKTLTSGEIFIEILKIAIPISLGQAIGSIMSLIDSMMIPGLLKMSGFSEKVATELYGQLTGKAFVLISVPLTLSMALAQSTVPAISESYAVKDGRRISEKIKTSYRLAMILALPCCAGLYALARPILSLIFQGMDGGWELLQILSIASIFIILAQTSTSVLNGIGRTIMPVLAMIAGATVKIIISSIFVPLPELNIRAAAYGTVISYAIVAIIDIIFVLKYTKTTFSLKNIFIGPMVCTVVMIFMVVLIYTNMYNLTVSNNISTMVSILGGVLVYVLMLIITNTLSISDMKRIFKNS